MLTVSDFDYDLPENLIAQLPAEKRDISKMLILNRDEKTIRDKHFYDIVDELDENDFLVLNNTKVLPARLYGNKAGTGAKIEIFLLERAQNNNDKVWNCLIKPSKRVKIGTIITISDKLEVKVLEELEQAGMWLVELFYDGNIIDVLHQFGNIPLPPYIERKLQSQELKMFDMERYQTVYAKDEGSVAAPTAGLHFTQEVFDKLEAKGVQKAYVTLNVGLGTFRPVMCENILDHKMHSEVFEITQECADAINKAKAQGKNIVAIGTTTVRTLETVMAKYGKIIPCHESSKLFIYPPYEFKIVDKLLTNFHLPKSTLLMLVSAFAGKDYIFESYKHAIANNYRFFSYGDCMLIK